MGNKLGQYEIIRELGRGGMGVVYLARDPDLDRKVAIKVLSQPISDDDVMVQRFLREARSAASLNHPNIVQVYFVGKHEDKHFFVMEFIKGRDLSDLIKEQGRMDPESAAQIILQAASGLAMAHDAGIFHRDIKPSNLIIDDKGLVKIADFGIAFKQEVGQKLTATGQFLGTPGYLCPEICLGETTDQRSDIFSLGIVFFEMLSGFSPFEADSPMAMMHKVVTAEVPDISQVNEAVDEKLVRILKKMVAKDRDHRFQNCHDLQTELESYLGIRRSQIGTRPYVASDHAKKTVAVTPPPPPTPEPVMAPPQPPVRPQVAPPPAAPRSRKSSSGILVWAILLFGFIAAALGIGGYLFWDWKTQQPGNRDVPLSAMAEDSPESVPESEMDTPYRDETISKSQVEESSEAVADQSNPQETGQQHLMEGNASKGRSPIEVETSQFEPEEAMEVTSEPMRAEARGSEDEVFSRKASPQPSLVATKMAKNDRQNLPILRGVRDPFGTSPVELPSQPTVYLNLEGDPIFAESMHDALAEVLRKDGYKVLNPFWEESNSGQHMGALQLFEDRSMTNQADLVVRFQAVPLGRMGVEYGRRSGGYRINDITRVMAQLVIPGQGRFGLVPWMSTVQYNVDTAEGEAGSIAKKIGQDWMSNALASIKQPGAPVLLAANGDAWVSDAVLFYLQAALIERGIPCLNLTELGIDPNSNTLEQLKRQSGAKGLITVGNSFLGDEQIQAYGQSSTLYSYRLRFQFQDLIEKETLQAKRTSFKFASLSLDGEAKLIVSEVLQDWNETLHAWHPSR